MDKQLNLAMQAAEIEVVKTVINKTRKRYVIMTRLPHTFSCTTSEGMKGKGYLNIIEKNTDKIAKFKSGTDNKIMLW